MKSTRSSAISRGFLWLCTAGGLSRFDGYTFVNFATENGLPDPVVNDILETRRGEYWLATNGGLVRFNPNGVPINDATNTNKSFTDSKIFSAILTDDQNQPISAINTLLEDRQGDLWCGTTKALYRLERSSASLTLHAIDLGMPLSTANAWHLNLTRTLRDLSVDGHAVSASFGSRMTPGYAHVSWEAMNPSSRVAGLASGRSIGQTLQDLGLSKQESKDAQRRVDEEIKNAERH
jgi:Two component regulator propeller